MKKLFILIFILVLVGPSWDNAFSGSPLDLGTAPRINNVLFYNENEPNNPTNEFEIGDRFYDVMYVSDADFDITTICLTKYYSSIRYFGPDCVILSSKSSEQFDYAFAGEIRGPAGLWWFEFQLKDAKGNESDIFSCMVNIIEPKD